MTYSLTLSNGEDFKEIQENEIETILYSKTENTNDATGGLALIGKLTANYGGHQSNNFIRLAENFANSYFPKDPLKGMLCYRSDKKSLYVCISETDNSKNEFENWMKLPSVILDTLEPDKKNAQNGDMWFKNDDKKLFIFDGETKSWICIGPEDYLYSINVSSALTTTEGNSCSYTYDFSGNNEANCSSYLATIKIIGKEIISESSDLFGHKATETASWIIKLLINSYDKINGDNGDKTVIREIVGEPSYETIGRTSGVAKDWAVNVKLNTLYNLQVDMVGEPTNSNNGMKMKWGINVEMNKIYD